MKIQTPVIPGGRLEFSRAGDERRREKRPRVIGTRSPRRGLLRGLDGRRRDDLFDLPASKSYRIDQVMRGPDQVDHEPTSEKMNSVPNPGISRSARSQNLAADPIERENVFDQQRAEKNAE